jgi:hypothetical protein
MDCVCCVGIELMRISVEVPSSLGNNPSCGMFNVPASKTDVLLYLSLQPLYFSFLKLDQSALVLADLLGVLQ